MLFHDCFSRQYPDRFPTIINAFTFIDQNIPIEDNSYILIGEITLAGIDQVMIDEPKQFLKSRLKFGCLLYTSDAADD